MRVLLVCPSFHGYGRAIAHGFESLGHDVLTILYDDRPNLGAKVVGKLWLDVPAHMGIERTRLARRRAGARVVPALSGIRPNVVVVVKGDHLDPSIWEPLRRKKIPAILWLYDEIHRTHHSLEIIETYDAVATYSAADFEALTSRSVVSRLVPMAFDPQLHPIGAGRTSEVAFIGARYPNREAIMTQLARTSTPVRAYGRDWSPRLVDRARTLHWRRPAVPGHPDVSREEAGAIMCDAIAVLNVHGAGHDGFNPRTFEASGVGGLQIIDREDVSTYYEPGSEILVFHSVDEITELVERARNDIAWADGIRARARTRTLAQHTYAHRCADLLALC